MPSENIEHPKIRPMTSEVKEEKLEESKTGGKAKIRVDRIEFDEEIYPRKNVSRKTVDKYVDALETGAEFPPVLVQKIRSSGEERIIALDGRHKILAFQEAEIEEIEAEHWKDGTLDREENLVQLWLKSARENRKHGNRLKYADIEAKARKIVREHVPLDELSGVIGRLAGELGVPEERMSEMVGDVVRERKGGRDALVRRLNLLGLTQGEIAERVGVNQSRVSQIINSLDREEINNLRGWGKKVGQIAEYHSLDVPTAWALLLKGEEDEQRFRKFGKEEYGNHMPHPGPSNYWEFERRDPRLGRRDEIPGQVLMNLLHRHTRRGDLVVDPMASGGVAVDACLVMGRECRAYDPEPERGGISELDVESEGMSETAEDCDLLLLNPLSDLNRIGSEGWRDLGAMAEDRFGSLERFKSYMEEVAEESFGALGEGSRVALTTWRNVRRWGGCPGLESTRVFTEAGFEQIERATFPLTDGILDAVKENWREWAIENKHLLSVLVDLLVFRKPGRENQKGR